MKYDSLFFKKIIKFQSRQVWCHFGLTYENKSKTFVRVITLKTIAKFYWKQTYICLKIHLRFLAKKRVYISETRNNETKKKSSCGAKNENSESFEIITHFVYAITHIRMNVSRKCEKKIIETDSKNRNVYNFPVYRSDHECRHSANKYSSCFVRTL